MDVMLNTADENFFTPYVYPTWFKEDDSWRQFLTLNVMVNLGGIFLYLVTATLSYKFVYDKSLLNHPHVVENQISREIRHSLSSLPWIGMPTAYMFLLEVRGHSKLYDNVHDSQYGWWAVLGSMVTFFLFTDFCIYWLHRSFHHRLIYKHIHKPHHIWKVPTPFASHANHPIDGLILSMPYHLYVFLFPMHKFAYLLFYFIINVWTVSIHDGDCRVPDTLKPIINGSAHHMDHHLYYNYNYGQYLTLWDRIGGTFRNPSMFEGKGPAESVKQLEQSGNFNEDKKRG